MRWPSCLASAGLLAAVFVALATAVHVIGVLPGDVWIRDRLLALASPPVTRFFGWITYAGDWRVVLPAMPLVLALPRIRRHWLVWLVFIAAGPILADHVLKAVVARPRPESADFGFPSGHATGAAAFMSGVAYGAATLRSTLRRLLTVTACGTIVLVAVARILLHAHWPSDVLGGVLLGFFLATCAALVTEAATADGG